MVWLLVVGTPFLEYILVQHPISYIWSFQRIDHKIKFPLLEIIVRAP